MGPPLKVVVASKHDSTCRSHIKYVDNAVLKPENNDLDGKILKSCAVLKKTALKTNFQCESYAPFKRA